MYREEHVSQMSFTDQVDAYKGITWVVRADRIARVLLLCGCTLSGKLHITMIMQMTIAHCYIMLLSNKC